MPTTADPVTLSTILAAIAALVSAVTSVLAIGLAYYTFRYTIRASSRPVLVFSMTTDMIWQIENVGTGPAVTVTIGVKWLSRDEWGTVVSCHSLAAGASRLLPWVHEGSVIAAVYSDVFTKQYTTNCVDGVNSFSAGAKFPDWKPEWSERELQTVDDPSLLKYGEGDLQGKTPFELDVMRNEFYARHGYRFRRRDLMEYFSKQPWYNPTTDDEMAVNRKLSKAERNSALFILYYQNRNNLRSKQGSMV